MITGDKNMKKLILFFQIFFLLTIFGVAAVVMDSENNNSKDEEVIIKKEDFESNTLAQTNEQKDVTLTAQETKEIKPEKQTEKKVKTKTTNQKKEVKKNTDIDKVQNLIAKLKDMQKQRVAMEADIVITTTYIDINSKQDVKGKLLIKKPDKFFVHYKEPSEQLLISDGKLLWVYTPELKQVIKQDIKEVNLNTHFYIEFETSIDYFSKNSKNSLKEDDKYYILTMKPLKNKSIDFDEIISKINKKTLFIEKISMKYENTLIEVKFSNISVYKMDEIKNNEKFSDENFVFKKKDDVEEIEATSLIKAQ